MIFFHMYTSIVDISTNYILKYTYQI